MRRAAVLILLAAALVGLAACGTNQPSTGGAPTSTAQTTSTAGETAARPTTTTTSRSRTDVRPRSARDGCRPVATPLPRSDPSARHSGRRLRRDRTHVLLVRTNCGTIRIRLAVKRSPKTVASFAGLVRQRFFDGLTFQRVAKPGGNDYVIQGGDPLLNGNGGPGYTVVERPSKRTRYVRYVVAMAKAQDERAGTSGSQFFIVTARSIPLAPEYAVLGLVTGGKKVVRRIARLRTDPATEEPVDPVVITSMRIRSSGQR